MQFTCEYRSQNRDCESISQSHKSECENFSHECEIWSRPHAGRPRTDELRTYYIKLINISGLQNLNPKSEIIFSKSGESRDIITSAHSRSYTIIINISKLAH